MLQTLFGNSEILTSPAAANNIGAFVTAPDKIAVRVLVANVGAVPLAVGATPAAVAGNAVNTGANFRLPAGRSEVFVLAPRQSLYAVGIGGGGRVSYSISEALPMAVQL